MKRKNVIAKGISWLLVTAMLITGTTSGISLPVFATSSLDQTTAVVDQTTEDVKQTTEVLEQTTEQTEQTTTVVEESQNKKEESTQTASDEAGQSTDNANEKEEDIDTHRAIVVVKSPIVNADNHSITFNLNAVSGVGATAKSVLLRGDVIDDWNVGKEMTKQDGAFTVTIDNVNPGVYTYKYVVDGTWITDPHNTKTVTTADGANSVVYMPGLSSPSGSISVMQGTAKTLPATLKYYDDAGNFEEVPVTYTLPEEYQNDAELVDGSITVNKEVGSTIDVIAHYGDETAAVKVSVVDEIYTYNIYYYDFEESRMTTNAAQLWLWEYKVSNGVPYDFTELVDVNGNNWLKASVELSYKDLAIIARSYGGWTWQNSSKGMVYHNEEGAGEVDLYIVSSSKTIYTEVPNLDSLKPRERYMLIEYDRPGNDYTNWEIYTWNSGYDTKIPLETIGGRKVAKIKIKDSVADMSLGFIMRRTAADTEWAEKDGGDNYLNMPADQTILKAQFVQGQGIVSTTPDNIGYIMDGADKTIHFYYRDDDKYLNYDMASLEGKVSIVINGEEHPMEYNSSEERFCYDLSDVTDGTTYQYYYLVDGQRVLDKFNEEVGSDEDGQYNICTYHEYKMNLKASLLLDSMDYNQNNVLTLQTDFEEGQDESAFEVKSITCDLSQLGGSSEFAIDPELMEGTIAVTDDTDPGDYTIPIVLYDIYGNKYETSIKVTVTARSKAQGEFDWDEAVVYFAVTDRFFDGDASNNDAYGVGDYNTSTATTKDGGGSCYHGGDFAGLTQKLDYLKELGINTIWITPIVENITQDLSLSLIHI